MELLLFLFGGRLYTWIELLWRGRTHWTMFIVGGVCFVLMGLLNEYGYGWDTPLAVQSIVSAVIITAFELVTGCIFNLWLGWGIWDYSTLPFNLFGQISLYYFLLWIPLSAVGIMADDWIRYFFYTVLKKYIPNIQERKRPYYKII